MKKFLSLVLALVMTMSLVTISAGATEYKDLTDKDEIQYEEAVAVLNRIGVISGYDDGSFRPETELTRGAAAKIIVSLMIGPEAASALPNNYSPYPDVPAGHTFAGVISYCKTAGYISGYGDGTFKPANSLTGYAFAKMLLGALGYKSEVEGFTGTGWTMNVAKFGNMANLFNRINFDGAASVNREQACQLALNTLKATMVEYTGGFNVTAGDATVVGAQTRTYVTSNQEYARHISERRAGGANTIGGNAVSESHYTVEFGEEHFKDLRMVSERGTADDFGRPSNEWSYKKVTIGTFPVEPDFTYTTQVTHATESTDAAKVRALGLSGYETEGVVRYTTTGAGITDKTVVFENGVVGELANNKVADIADLTDNGTLVEVYVSEEDADFIETVVVVKTQLMEIKRVGSEAVALDKKDADADGEVFYGYNQAPIDVVVNDVEIDDDCFKVLSEMKAGDLVAVVPVAPDHPATAPTKYDVGRVYAPESVSGKLSNVKQFTKSGAEETIAVTVGDTAYNVALWNKDLHKVNGDKVKITRKDVTLYLDEYGNALLAKGVGDTSNWMVIGSYSQGLVNNRIVNYVNGWDIGGEELSLNIGSTTTANQYINGDGYQPGCLVYYTNDVNSNTAEWLLSKDTAKGVFNVFTGKQADDAEPYKIEASNKRILLEGFNDATVNPDDGTGDGVATVDSGIKFIYVTVDNSDGEVDSVEFRSGVQAATNDELKEILNNRSAQAAVSLEDYKAGNLKDVVTVESGVKAVVIKRESSEATVNNLLYIEKVIKTATLDTEGQPVYVYQCYDTEGEMIEVASYRKINPGNWVKQNAMATPEAAKGIEGVTEDNFKRLTGYGADGYQAETWQRSAAVAGTKLINVNGTNKYLLTTNGTYGNTGRAVSAPDISKAWDRDKYDLGVGNGSNMIDAKGAEIIDLRTDPNRRLIDSIDQIKDAINGKGDFQYKTVNGAQVETKGYDLNATILFNDNTDSNDFRTAYVIIIHSITEHDGSSVTPPTPTDGSVKFADGFNTDKKLGDVKNGTVEVDEWGEVRVTFTLTKPSWAYAIEGVYWAAANSQSTDATPTAEVSYDIYRDGAPYKHAAKTINASMTSRLGYLTANGKTNADTTEFTGTYRLTKSEMTPTIGDTHTYSIQITGIKWNYVPVEYVMDGEKTVTIDGAKWLKNGIEQGFGFTAKGLGNVNGATAAIAGVDNADTFKDVHVSGNDVLTSENVKPVGNKPVVVTITLPDDYTEKFPVSIFDENGDKQETSVTMNFSDLTINEAPAADVDVTGGTVKVTADKTMVEKKAGASVTYGVELEVTKKGIVTGYEVTYTLTVNGKTTTKTELFDFGNQNKVSKNILVTEPGGEVTLSIDSLKAVKGYSLYATGAVVKADENGDKKFLEVTFNKDLSGSVNEARIYSGTKGTAATDIATSANGKVLTIKFDTALTQTSAIWVDGAVTDGTNANKEVKITFDANLVATLDHNV